MSNIKFTGESIVLTYTDVKFIRNITNASKHYNTKIKTTLRGKNLYVEGKKDFFKHLQLIK